MIGRLTTPCALCGLEVMGAHQAKHEAAHDDQTLLHDMTDASTYFCELCGLMFRWVFQLMITLYI